MNQDDVCGFDEALRKVLGGIAPIRQTETVMLDRALGRVTARSVVCRKNMPAFDNSAMDGFAVRQEDAGKRVAVVATVYAGDVPQKKLQPGEAVRIMTGAPIPDGADTIVPIEQALEVTGETVTLPETLQREANIRRRGEEQTEGGVLFETGVRLEPFHIAMLSAQGMVAVEVAAPLRIAVVSTGDEIREPWEQSADDTIYNANAFGVRAVLERYGFTASYIGSIPDDSDRTVRAIARLKGYDVIISTGGASRGAADFLYDAYTQNGMETFFRGIRVKPGHPVTMGTMGNSLVMALPGNPLAALVNLVALGIPVLRRLRGERTPTHTFVALHNLRAFHVRPGRTHLVLGRIEDGGFYVTRDNRYGSGMITPLMESDALAILDEESSGAEEGDLLNVLMF